MISNYNKENVKFEIGEKIRYDGRVATLIKPMANDRWQIKYNDGHRETVPKNAIKPYKTELSTRRELYGEDNQLYKEVEGTNLDDNWVSTSVEEEFVNKTIFNDL